MQNLMVRFPPISKRALSTFCAGDVALIRMVDKPDRVWLTKPLEESKTQGVHSGDIPHSQIIGKNPRCFTPTTKNGRFRYIVTHPTQEEFINLSPRNAQPIYPFDAASIVNLAELHIDYPQLSETGEIVNPVQILEAGTGHGSLTLCLAKALHPANCHAYEGSDGSIYKRGAILHSLDQNSAHLKTGRKTLAQFQRGIYAKNVDFHLVESPSKWLEEQWDSQNQLDAAFLDMPSSEDHFKAIAQNLKIDCPIILFSPSVTQILDAVKHVHLNRDLRLSHIRTMEFIPGAGGGMREWNVGFTTVRSTGEQSAICRPKVGIRVCGGGFVGIFKKLPPAEVVEGAEIAEIGCDRLDGEGQEQLGKAI